MHLSTCEQLPARKVNVKFPDTWKQMWRDLPAVDDVPHYSTKTEAGVALLKESLERLLESPKMRDPTKLLDIARPSTSEKTQLTPSSSKMFDFHLSIKNYLIISVISFTGFMLRQVPVALMYHR